MIIDLNTAPAAEPISTADAKAHCRVDGSDDDSYIDAIVAVARVHTENITGRALITQTWDFWIDNFKEEIELPKAPLQSVSAITYVDLDGVEQTLSTGVYTVDADSDPGRVYEAYGQSWPSVRDVRKAVKVTFVAGYGNAGSDVPKAIIQAMKLLVGHLYENREAIVDGQVASVPMGYDALIAPYRVHSF